MIAVSAILLRDRHLPRPEQLAEVWAQLFPDRPAPRFTTVDGAPSCDLPCGALLLTRRVVGSPPELDTALGRNIAWPEPWLGEHTAHLLVVASAGEDLPSGQLDLEAARAIATFATALGAEGVLAGDLGVPWPVDRYAEIVCEADDTVPWLLWVAIQGVRHRGVLNLVTEGMDRYHAHDLWIATAPDRREEALDLLNDMVAWLAAEQPTLRPGQTISRTPDEKIVVRTAKAPWGPDRAVWMLHI